MIIDRTPVLGAARTPAPRPFPTRLIPFGSFHAESLIDFYLFLFFFSPRRNAYVFPQTPATWISSSFSLVFTPILTRNVKLPIACVRYGRPCSNVLDFQTKRSRDALISSLFYPSRSRAPADSIRANGERKIYNLARTEALVFYFYYFLPFRFINI